MKLYRVTCRGMASRDIGSGMIHGCAYVVAEDPSAAYTLVREFLDVAGLGTDEQRELDKIELMADAAPWPSCGTRLYVQPQKETAHDS